LLISFGAGLLLVLILIAVWQGRIDRGECTRVVQQIRDAEARGADRPVGQYPHIDPFLCLGCSSCVRACPEEGVLEMVGGIAHVVQAARCIGHARCQEVCPVGALKVGLGDLASRPDIPHLTDELESTVPGVFVAGELGGLALIRHACVQGASVVESIARRANGRPPTHEELLIVGAGPSGFAAALKATELGLRYRIIDQSDVGGTVRKYPRRKLVLTQPVALPMGERLRRREYVKEELVDLFRDAIRKHAIRVESGTKLLGVRRDESGGLEASTSGGTIRSRNLLLALGRRGSPRKLGVPGEEMEKVLYQLVDAASYTGQRILVVGGGDSAIEAATALADQPGNAVTVSYRKDAFFRIKARNEQRIREYREGGRIDLAVSSSVASIERDRVVLNVGGSGTDGAVTLPNDFVLVFAGGEPPYPLLRQIGVGFCADEGGHA
jgi:thioredoxin reductase/NAD-dependent dihydropyrimidine dehydrogenase PreA subunit